MLPLILKDGDFIAAVALLAIFMVSSKSLVDMERLNKWKYFFGAVFAGSVVITLLILFVRPPTSLPDLFVLIQAAFCCGNFMLFLIYFNWTQFFSKSGRKVKNS